MLGEGKALLEEEGQGETFEEALALARAVAEGRALREFEELRECVRVPCEERDDEGVRGAVGEEAESMEGLAGGEAVDCRAGEIVAPIPAEAREGDAAEEGVAADDVSAVSVAALLGVPPDAEAVDVAEGSREALPELEKMDAAVAVEAAASDGDGSSDAEAGALGEG